MESKIYNISQKILSQNDLKARELREIYAQNGLFVINLMSSPGSGKTTLLENLSKFGDLKFSVIEGDLETNRDAERLRARGILTHQITTGDACHLDAMMVEGAFRALQEMAINRGRDSADSTMARNRVGKNAKNSADLTNDSAINARDSVRDSTKGADKIAPDSTNTTDFTPKIAADSATDSTKSQDSTIPQKPAPCPLGDYLFIENVGNLVCPASYDLGANVNVVLLSTPEGDDKVLKYPTMFLCADIVLISKADIMEHFDFEISRVERDLSALNNRATIFTIDKTPKSLAPFVAHIAALRARGFASSYQF